MASNIKSYYLKWICTDVLNGEQYHSLTYNRFVPIDITAIAFIYINISSINYYCMTSCVQKKKKKPSVFHR